MKENAAAVVVLLLIFAGCLFSVTLEDFPSYFDLREQNRVTAVDQSSSYYRVNAYTVCASIESFLAPGEYRNFYEDDMRAWMSERFDFCDRRPTIFQMAVACLAAWAGPRDIPEDGYTYWHVGGIDAVQKHIQQVVFLPGRKNPLDNDIVKWFIMNYGAVYAELTFVGEFYDSRNCSYYHFGHFGDPDEWPLFSTAIVGWDDHLDRYKFNTPAPGDGAFIAKNSWGDDFGEGGYFYVSYYDTDLKFKASFNNAEAVTNYGDIYQYDLSGATTSAGGENTIYWGANVFTARENSALEAVSFYTNDAGTYYEIYIYTGLNATAGSPVQGNPVATKTGSFTYPGYYTVKPDTPVPLNLGETFSVVVRFQNSQKTAPVFIEAPVLDYSSPAAANPGESFISSDGRTWQDLTLSHPGSNVCIKAFTAFNPPFPFPVIHLDARMYSEGLWLFDKQFVVVSFTIENISAVPVRDIFLYRKRNDEQYKMKKVISPGDLQNGRYTFIEEHVDPGSYTYHVTVYTEDDRITGKSKERTVKIE